MLLRDDLLEVYDLNRLNAHLLITSIPEPFFHYREQTNPLINYTRPVESQTKLLPEGLSLEGLSVTPGPIPGFDVQRMPMDSYLKETLAPGQVPVAPSSAAATTAVTKRKSASSSTAAEPKRPRNSSMVTTSRY